MFLNGYQGFQLEKTSMGKIMSPPVDIYEKLYEKLLNFNLEDGSFTRNVRKLCISIERQPSSSGTHNKDLLVNLTDPEDPFFLYTLVLTSDDFLSLKQQQSLLVDYTDFPRSLISLLEKCFAEENKAEPRFLLCLKIREVGSAVAAQLDIAETTQVKLLPHLSLELTPPADAMIKQYMSSCYKDMKEMKSKLESKVVLLEKELQKQEKQVQESKLDQESRQKAMEAETLALKQAHGEELRREKDAHQNAMEMERIRARKEIEQVRNSCNLEKKAFDEKISKLMEENKSYAAQIKELNDQLKKSSSDENSEQWVAVAEKNEQLEAELEVVKKKLSEMEVTNNKLKVALEAQEIDVNRAKNEVISLQVEKSSLQTCLFRSRSMLQEKEIILADTTKDLEISNGIIKKLQSEARVLKDTLRTKDMLVMQLKNILQEKELDFGTHQKEVLGLKTAIQMQNEEMSSLSKVIQNLKSRLATTEQLLQEKDCRLAYLNRKFDTEQSSSPNAAAESKTKSASAADQAIQKSAEPRKNLPSSKPSNAAERAEENTTRRRDVSLDPRYLEKHPRIAGSGKTFK